MDWMKIATAMMLVMMLVFLFPRVRHMVKNSPKGSASDWMSAIIPLVLVIGFVAFLIKMV